ncbi:MAG: hypothetical protein ABW034_23620 [Steroidobacteraceae bacterium]
MASVTNESFSRAAAPQALVSYTHLIYALHAASVLIGVFTAAGVLTSFLFGIPSIIGVVMNYARRPEARGTWLESHFRWQIRTFWIAAAIGLVSFIVSAPLMLVLIGFVLWWALVTLTGMWVFYRVVRGWLRLRDGREMYAA